MPTKNRQLVEQAIALLANTSKDIIFDAIVEALETEQVSENLLALDLINQEEAGEIVVEGLFQSLQLAFDEVFSLGDDEDEEEQPKSDINFPCCGNHKNKNTK
jgi:hypothetical protein